MDDDMPVGAEADAGRPRFAPDAEPREAAEPRAIPQEGVRALIFKHANDRRTLDRVLARMRGR